MQDSVGSPPSPAATRRHHATQQATEAYKIVREPRTPSNIKWIQECDVVTYVLDWNSLLRASMFSRMNLNTCLMPSFWAVSGFLTKLSNPTFKSKSTSFISTGSLKYFKPDMSFKKFRFLSKVQKPTVLGNGKLLFEAQLTVLKSNSADMTTDDFRLTNKHNQTQNKHK